MPSFCANDKYFLIYVKHNIEYSVLPWVKTFGCIVSVKNYDNNSEITELNNQLKYIADSEKCEFCDISEKRVWNPQQIKDVSSFVYNIGFVHPLNNKRPLNNLVKMLFCINDLTP